MAAIMTVLGVAVFLAAGSAKAEAHPLHVRHAAVGHKRAAHLDREHLRVGVARVHAGETKAKRISATRIAARRISEKRASTRNGETRFVRTSARRRERFARRGDRTPLIRRASVERTYQTSRRMHDGREIAEVAGPSSASEIKPLTVNDFTHAASRNAASAPGVYASGVSSPDEDVSLTAPHRSIGRTPPSDIAGAPLEPSAEGAERPARTEEAQQKSHMELRSANRQELTEEVEQPIVLPGLYRNGRLVVPRPLKGTREILMHQNIMADDEGLNRIRDDYDLRRMRAAGLLVDLPESASLHLNPELASDRRCARPWTVHFASDIARAYYARFHEPLQVNSAVRTVSYQLKLRRVNGNAAGIDGDLASPHLTGQALDFGKHGMSTQQIAWMRLYLLPLMQAGKLDVEEEFQQACFHISVYRTYSPASRRRSYPRGEVAQLGELRVSKTLTRVALDR